MNYEFHVGDYVKTRAGYIGYVESVHDLLNGTTGLYVRFVDGDCHCFEVTNKTISNNFLHIGAYDFTKKEKKKIEQLDYIVTETGTIYQLSALKNKINELVDAVNKLMNKEDEE